uniref:Uncharacterized protein n=1 Tax=Arundo donax TaxID=35708 RepID=A0A0A9H992_ARUDO
MAAATASFWQGRLPHQQSRRRDLPLPPQSVSFFDLNFLSHSLSSNQKLVHF